MRQDRLEFRAENQLLLVTIDIQRLQSDPIPRQHEPPPRPIPDRKRKHPPQPRDQLLAVLLVEMDQHFGVRPAAEPVALGLKLPAKLLEVVDLPVEDDLDRPILVAHGLVAAIDINNRQPPVRQPNARRREEPLGVRPAMGNGVGHRFEYS
ncbi:MAG: hypothetical protein A2V70_10120 [Planctomycetes bacterium RBG_13_63_9]|nr:MAG: hypothetical protein A2V70_10120 [Planctomycetes bacterium RBG_13_63_9]